MTRMLKLTMALAVMASLLTAAVQPAHAQDAQSIWNRVVQRIRSTKDYTLSFNSSGPKGEYIFDYAVVRPNEIRSKIVKGANAGAVLIYNPNEYGNEVKARKGWLGKSIALNDPKVANTPIVQPVFDMLLDHTRGASPSLSGNATVSGHACYVLSVGNSVVSVDKSTYDVLEWKSSDNEGTVDRVFYNIQLNVHPRIAF